LSQLIVGQSGITDYTITTGSYNYQPYIPSTTQYYPQPYYVPYPVTLEAPMSKTEQAMKVVQVLFDEGLLKEELTVKEFLSLIAKVADKL
jgi:hypothetical protein